MTLNYEALKGMLSFHQVTTQNDKWLFVYEAEHFWGCYPTSHLDELSTVNTKSLFNTFSISDKLHLKRNRTYHHDAKRKCWMNDWGGGLSIIKLLGAPKAIPSDFFFINPIITILIISNHKWGISSQNSFWDNSHSSTSARSNLIKDKIADLQVLIYAYCLFL